jgi:hypothetical protein
VVHHAHHRIHRAALGGAAGAVPPDPSLQRTVVTTVVDMAVVQAVLSAAYPPSPFAPEQPPRDGWGAAASEGVAGMGLADLDRREEPTGAASLWPN